MPSDDKQNSYPLEENPHVSELNTHGNAAAIDKEQNGGERSVEDIEEQNTDEDTTTYVGGIKLGLILVGISMAVFLVALDSTIIAPALGAITTQFHSVKDIVIILPFCLNQLEHLAYIG